MKDRRNNKGSHVSKVALHVEQTETGARDWAPNGLDGSSDSPRNFLDEFPYPVWRSDKDGKCNYLNRAWLDFTGRTREQELGDGWTEDVHPDDLDFCLRTYVDAFNARQAFEMEYRLRGHNGTYRWINDCGRPFTDREGNFAGYVGTCFDTTERKLLEESLHKAQARTESVLASVADLHILFDRDWHYLYVNDAAVRAIGRVREEIVGCTLWEMYPDILGTELDRQYHRAMDERVPVSFEFHYSTLNTWWENHFYPTPDGLAVFATNITKRKNAEESLKLFRSLLDRSSDAIEVIDPETLRFLDCNESACQCLGYSREEFLALSVFDIDPKIDELRIATVAAETKRSGFALFESIHRRKDGSTFPVEVNVREIQLERAYRLAIVRDITERKRAEDALREAERKYREIFENAGEGIFQSTPDGRYISANPALARMHGFDSPEDLIRSRDDISRQVYVDSTRREEFKRLVEEQGIIRGFEHQVSRKDGSKIWISVNARAVRDEGGAIRYYEGTAQDINERKQAEEALRKSEQRYRDLVENSRELICTHDLDGLILSANRAAVEVLGYDPQDYCGQKNFRDLLAPEVRDQFDEYLARIRSDGLASGLTVVQTSGGDRRVLEYHNTVRTEGVDTPIVRGMARDITEQRRAEKALRASEERYRELFENAKDAIYVHDLSGRYTSVNRAAERLSGFTREEILGKHFSNFVLPRDLKHVRTNLCRKLDEENETIYEVDMVRRDGQRVPVEISSRLIYENGVAVGVQGVARDVTERKRSQDALRTFSQRLIQAQEIEREKIARELHDEIGQVLTAVRINLQSVQHSCGTHETVPRLDESIGIVDEALGRVRELSIELRPALLDDLGLRVALRWYVDRYSQRTGIAAEVLNGFEDDTRLPRELETACFRIAQEALTNVARHAQAVSVSVQLERFRERVLLTIMDDGVGFNIDDLRKSASAASALGLRGMEERALAVGGYIEIDSGSGRGTRIRATFPFRRR